MTVHSEWSKNTCLECLSQICSERLKSALVCGGCLPCGKEGQDQREGWQEYLQKEVKLLVINLSNFCPCIFDAFWPLCISTENTVRNVASTHLSCSATSFPHLCSKEFISSPVSPFTLGIFPWIHCYEVYALHSPLNLLILMTWSWFFFSLSPSLQFL